MASDDDELQQLLLRRSLYPERSRALRICDTVAQALAVTAIVVSSGVWGHGARPWQFGAVPVVAMLVIAGGLTARYRWSLRKPSFWTRHRVGIGISGVWAMGVLIILIGAPLWADSGHSAGEFRWSGVVLISELLLLAYAVAGVIQIVRSAAAHGVNPAVQLVSSFAGLILVGTMILMLPRCRASEVNPADAPPPWFAALFTATSASCVTGLTVVDTDSYWSHTGQLVILVLIQVGGLGIMAFGAFFAAFAGRGVAFREHASLRELLASAGSGNVRRLALSIIGVTVATEAIGALLMSGLWGDLPVPERAYQSIFHSVSAFCNAGFALDPNSFVGRSGRWQVWGVLTGLIVIGGLGFPVLQNVFETVIRRRGGRSSLSSAHVAYRPRLSLSSKLVLLTTAGLLAGGTLGLYLLEMTGSLGGQRPPLGLADSWFQSVTFRTAGFNTVDLDALQPASQLFAIGLMFIGASPGSTGGGVKTLVLAVFVLGLFTTLRGRPHLECMGRTIADSVVSRALVIVFIAFGLVMAVTMLLLLFEQQPGNLLDYMFEATSALCTVGVSSSAANADGVVTSTTRSLGLPSQFLIVLAMFVGRVGPLTLLMALARQSTVARYQYPQESVNLG